MGVNDAFSQRASGQVVNVRHDATRRTGYASPTHTRIPFSTDRRRNAVLPFAAFGRAAVAAAALAALGPAADARKRRRRPPPPLAFLAIAVQRVELVAGVDGPFYRWTYQAQLRAPGFGNFTQNLTDTVAGTGATASQEETRDQLVRGARSLARTFLLQAGHDVPEDRIAVVLL
jgi:hypothetical protein